MTDNPETPAPPHSAFLVLAALADLGEATAAAIAEKAELGYSTVTPKLRAWEISGHAERFRNGQNQTQWRLTDNGRATTTAPPGHGENSPQPAEPAATDRGAAQPAIENGDEITGASAADAEHQNKVGVNPKPGRQQIAASDGHAAETANDTGDSTEAAATAGDPHEPEIEASASAGAAPDSTPDTTTKADTKQRRPSGSLRGALLDILESHPGQNFKVAQLSKLIDKANEGAGANGASAGAVANAAHKLVEQGKAVLVAEKPATFGLAAADV